MARWPFAGQLTIMNHSAGTRLGALPTLSHSLPTTTLQGGHYNLHYMGEKTKAQRATVIHERPFSFSEAELGFEPKSVSKAHAHATVPYC